MAISIADPMLFRSLFIEDLYQWLLRFNEGLDVNGGGLYEIILEQISPIERSRHAIFEQVACQLELNYRSKVEKAEIPATIQGLLQCSDPQYFVADMIHRDEDNFGYIKRLGQVNVMYAIGIIRKALVTCSELMFNLSYPVRKKDLALIIVDPDMTEILKKISQDRVRFTYPFSFAKCQNSSLGTKGDGVEDLALKSINF